MTRLTQRRVPDLERLMIESDPHQFVERYVAMLNTHRFERLGEFMHEDLTVNGQPTTRAEVISVLQGHVAAVPDLEWRLTGIAVDGDAVAAVFFNRGRPVAEWHGAQPNGAVVEFSEHMLHRVRDGRFHALNFLLDIPSIREQMAA